MAPDYFRRCYVEQTTGFKSVHVNKPHRSLIRRPLQLCWSILSWLVLVLIVCAIGIGVYIYYRADDELKKHVEATLAKSYPNLSISIGGTRLLRGEGIRIRDISVVEPGDQHIRARSEIAFIEEIFLLCDQ